MRSVDLPVELSGGAFCPTCGLRLRVGTSVDPFVICLTCDEHRWFVPPEGPYMEESAKASSVRLSGLPDQPEAIAQFWLSDPAARAVLNSQLAELLRTILEPPLLAEPAKFRYCPVCGDRLSEYEQPDIWVQGLRCPRQHAWAQRGGRLGTLFTSGQFGIHSEVPESSIGSLIQWWLKRHPLVESNIHDSVRSVLAHALRERAA